MKTKLISITDSLISEQKLSPEELIVYTARVSNPENQLNTETSDKLLHYLIKHKHWSPFEMVDMTVEITTSRAIAQQILRHRSFSFQEFSQRYSKATKLESIDLRYKGKTNRQSSENSIDTEDHEYFGQKISTLMNDINNLYNEMIDNDIAKECARMILPLATQTRIYMKGSVRSWIHYLQIRTDEHTQLEHREIADEIKNIFIEKFPNISKALNF
jgi:thymidylate synthase (FAD)